MSLKRICAAVALATLFASCTHVGTKVGNLSKGGFTTIVVDAGHGGKDNGGTSGRGSNPFQREKDLTLDTAKRVREFLRRSGFRVVMMREGDYFVELDERVARANKEGSHAILVSIHYNATSNSSKNGAETYYWRADSHGLATRIESHLVSATGSPLLTNHLRHFLVAALRPAQSSPPIPLVGLRRGLARSLTLPSLLSEYEPLRQL
jgi:N-acetylmuramoyl-L-alanine amidase